MRTGRPQLLPHSKPKEPVTPFRIGERVKMRACPDSQPGTVVGQRGNKLLIQWHDLNYVGKHHRSSLKLAVNKEESDGHQI
jgi:hypothetical protein